MATSLSCTICTEFYKNNDEILCTNCGHVFHKICFLDWKCRSPTCPDCRLDHPDTQRIYLHFEEHEDSEKKFMATKLELSNRISVLEQQLEESEQNFVDALQALSVKEEQFAKLNNELQLSKAQNASYELELKLLKQKNCENMEDAAFVDTLRDINITDTDMKIETDIKNLRIADQESKNNLSISNEASTSNPFSHDFENEPNAVVTTTSNTLMQSPHSLTNTDSVPNTFVRKKSIFASRFASDTPESAVLFYIKEKLPYVDDITIFKFHTPSYRRICSFRITVPEAVFDIMMLPGFWPSFIYVNEYIPRYRSDDIIGHIEVSV